MRSYSLIATTLLAVTCIDCSGQSGHRDDITLAMRRLSRGTTDVSFAVFSSFPSDHAVQFFVHDGVIYFDFPLRAELRKRFTSPLPTDSLSDSLIVRAFTSPSERANILAVLESFALQSRESRVAFIDPKVSSRDTTGWTITLQGPYTLGYERTEEFLDSVFAKVWSLKKGEYSLTIQSDEPPVR